MNQNKLTYYQNLYKIACNNLKAAKTQPEIVKAQNMRVSAFNTIKNLSVGSI